ncbi:hypothetical protein [Streptomyces sp. enrichment culture]|uniref:hypothetical protein n=1 Tax=Streptomyces sp. enrichment culture TaxID=1795815 RepID=UPI003F57D6E0
MRKSGPITDPQQPSPTDRSDADDVEQHACPKCDAQPGSPCRSRGGAVASARAPYRSRGRGDGLTTTAPVAGRGSRGRHHTGSGEGAGGVSCPSTRPRAGRSRRRRRTPRRPGVRPTGLPSSRRRVRRPPRGTASDSDRLAAGLAGPRRSDLQWPAPQPHPRQPPRPSPATSVPPALKEAGQPATAHTRILLVNHGARSPPGPFGLTSAIPQSSRRSLPGRRP